MMSFGNDSDRPWVLDETAAEPIVKAAVDGGITFFDTADTYSHGASEVATGNLVGKMLSRDQVVIATKVFMPMTPGENGGGLSRKHILSAIDASLERLGMDYVDLYQIHRWDNRTPIEETMGALEQASCAPAGTVHRSQQHVRLAVREGATRGRTERLDAVRVDAEPLQPRLPRRRTRDDSPVCRPGRRRDSLEPPRTRRARRQPQPRGRTTHDALGDRQLH
jgi:aryl-alcohol dehydrogenase-like predicted oxidoreductase